MTAIDLNTLVVLAERARGAGLIQFSEFSAALAAVENAKKEILESQKNAQQPEPKSSKPA